MREPSTALPTTQTTSQAEVAATNSVTGLQGFGQSVWLDDLHRGRKISDESYHKRRAELKEILKGMM